MALGIFEQLDMLNGKVKKLCCTVEKLLPTNTSSFPVSFTNQQIYGSATSPLSGNVTDNLSNANLGIVQKIYHDDSVIPTFPAGWVQLGITPYATNNLNIIYAEWAGGTRVEYWITQ